MPIHAMAAHAAKKPLEKFQYEPAPLGPHDVEIEITHCGICHSDLHLIDNDWGMSTYPLVPGHEIVGIVKAVGSEVAHLRKGMRVGVGWQRNSCQQCEFCQTGQENLCAKMGATCLGNYGGFATAIRTDSRFAFPIPDALASENAAPLLCGGATTYSPFRLYEVRPSMKVGVIGIGGLGHLGLQWARAWGCEVTALSTTPEKEQEAKRFGAHHFLNTRDAGMMKKAAGTFDFLLNTVFAPQDWGAWLDLLRPNGKLCVVGVPSEPITIPGFPLLLGQKSVVGSVIGSRHMIAEMLAFAARHGVKAQTETFPLDKANDALARLKANRARYRLVLTV